MMWLFFFHVSIFFCKNYDLLCVTCKVNLKSEKSCVHYRTLTRCGLCVKQEKNNNVSNNLPFDILNVLLVEESISCGHGHLAIFLINALSK